MAFSENVFISLAKCYNCEMRTYFERRDKCVLKSLFYWVFFFLLRSVCFGRSEEHLCGVTLMAFLTLCSIPFKHQSFHDFLHFWCNFLPVITLFVPLFIRQCTCNGNIRPRLAFRRTKTKFNLMCLAVEHHCWRDAIKTILSVFILVLELGHVEPLW